MSGTDWKPVSTMPKNTWCRTWREGEIGSIVSMWVGEDEHQDEREYWDKAGYSTVINPGSFAPPTHWDYLEPKP